MFQRFLTYIAGILVFAVAGLFVAPNFLDLSKFKNEFSATIKDLTGQEPVIEGDVKVSFLPYPKLTLGNISIPNSEGTQSQSILSADGVEANFTFTSLAKGKFDPSSITLIKPRFEIEKMPNGQQNWLNLLRSKGEAAGGAALKLPHKIIITNGTITYRSGITKTSIESISSNVIIASPKGPFDLNGSFQQDATPIKFNGKIGSLNSSSDSTFSITSDSFDFSMKGKFTPGDNFDMSGSTELNVKNIGKFADSFFIDSPVMRKIKSSEILAVKGDFVISKEITSFKKLVIASDSIKGTGNVDILYGASGSDSLQWDIALKMDKINSDSLRKEKAAAKTDDDLLSEAVNLTETTGMPSYHFDLPADLSANFKLSLAELIYNGDKVTHLAIDTEVFGGKAIVHSLSASLPGNSKIEFTGNVDNNGVRPLFIGKIKAYGDNLRSAAVWLYPQYSFVPEDQLKEFLFSCDLSVTPRIMTISNIYGSVDRTLVNGSILLHPTDTIPSINADLKIDRLNFDKYNATGQINNYISEFIAKAKDSSVDTSWLKAFNSKLALSISGDDMVYNNNNIKNFSASIGAAKGLLSVQNINIDSDFLKLRGKLGVNFLKETPEMSIDMTSTNFDTAAFITPPPTDKKKDTTSTETNASIASKEPINLMGINRFNGKLSIVFEIFKHKNLLLNNLILKGDLKKDIFSISEFKSNFGEKGKFSIKGSAGVSAEAPSIGISILASDVDLQDILHAVNSTNTTKGTIYIGGVIKTFGVSFYDWVNELKANAKVSTRNVEITGLNLAEIIEQSKKLYSVIDMNTVINESTQKGTTKFTIIDGNLVAEKSILQAKDFVLATEKSRGAFAGNISLHNLKMKGLAKIDYIPEYNKTVSLGISLDGAIPDLITYKLDKSNLEQYITGKASR